MKSDHAKPVGIVVGLAAEARLAREWGVPVAVGGGGAAGAVQAADRLAPEVCGLVSFGLAGGLDPELHAGEVVIPRRVIDRNEGWDTDPTLNAALGGCTGHTLLGGGLVLATVQDKRSAWAGGAQAVDLESAAVARAARRHGLPFAVLRAICDEAGRELPSAALAALDGAGRIGLSRVLRAILRRPWEIPGLISLGRDAGRARAALLDRVRTTRMVLETA